MTILFHAVCYTDSVCLSLSVRAVRSGRFAFIRCPYLGKLLSIMLSVQAIITWSICRPYVAVIIEGLRKLTDLALDVFMSLLWPQNRPTPQRDVKDTCLIKIIRQLRSRRDFGPK